MIWTREPEEFDLDELLNEPPAFIEQGAGKTLDRSKLRPLITQMLLDHAAEFPKDAEAIYTRVGLVFEPQPDGMILVVFPASEQGPRLTIGSFHPDALLA